MLQGAVGDGVASSLPVRGAWVEIVRCAYIRIIIVSSLPVRGAWVEISAVASSQKSVASLPVRGAWVEMPDVPLMRMV